MERYLYLSMTPEALISSMLPPAEFGNYQAVGTKKRTRGQAIFFEVDIEKAGDYVPHEYIERRCVPHKDGSPKRSVYLSIYRVLETIPLQALKNLYLTTDDGRVLSLEQAEYTPYSNNLLHLYQELCPVTVRVASNLGPTDFMARVTDTSHHVAVPRLLFADLLLGDLANDPVGGLANNLPYANIPHLRDCLIDIHNKENKLTKTVIRFMKGEFLYRTTNNGFFVGDQKTMLFYPFPSKEELEEKHYTWWRSAQLLGF